MIELVSGSPEGTLEILITGTVTNEDYDSVLTPAIERALEEHDRIKVLVQVGPGFEGYSLDAAWDDTKLGLRHWKGFERAAVVTDVPWIKMMTRAFSFALPYPVQTFELGERDDARRWLSESLGTIRIRDEGNGVVHVSLIGLMEASAYEQADDELEDLIEKYGRIRLLLDLREFDGWQGLDALATHLSLVREHRKAPEKVAVVGDATWMDLARRVFSVFTGAESRFFAGDQFDDPEAWIRS